MTQSPFFKQIHELMAETLWVPSPDGTIMKAVVFDQVIGEINVGIIPRSQFDAVINTWQRAIRKSLARRSSTVEIHTLCHSRGWSVLDCEGQNDIRIPIMVGATMIEDKPSTFPNRLSFREFRFRNEFSDEGFKVFREQVLP